MKLRLLLVLTVSLTFLSCKKDNEETINKADSAATEVEVDKDLLKVSFNLIIKKDDNLHLYYTEDGSINFDEKQSIWLPVKGNDNSQKVTFNLPKDVYPTALRVDFGYGKNIEQSDVALLNFSMSFYDNKFESNGLDILNYFYPMKENTEVLPGTSTLRRLAKDQESGPILYPLETLTAELEKISK